MKDEKIINTINRLTTSFPLRRQKYRRNASLYYSNLIQLDNNCVNWIPGYNMLSPGDQNIINGALTENVTASVVDTLVSQVASQKVRPSFVTIDGNWKDIMATNMCQRFFDIYFDRQNINTVITEIFNDACIYDTGYLLLDPKNLQIYRVAPWMIYYDPYEEAIENKTKICIWYKDYPTSCLDNYDGEEDTCEFIRYWDIKDKIYVEAINHKITHKEKWDKEILPVLDIKYSLQAINHGGYSLVDRLVGIQSSINIICLKIYQCIERSMAMKYVVPEGTKYSKMLNTKIGEILEYKPNGTSSQPVTQLTPAAFDPSWLKTLQQLKEDAYETSGVSHVAARGEVPTRVDSGKMLEAFEAQQDARFQTQVNRIIRLYTAIAYSMIKIFDSNEDILPDYDFKWKDIVKSSERMKIQYAVQSSISKSPEQQLAYVKELINGGWVSREVGATMLDIPDSEKAHALSAQTYNAVCSFINSWIDGEIKEIPFYIPIKNLKQEIRSIILSTIGSRNKETEKIVKSLSELYKKAMMLDMEMKNAQTEEEMASQEQQIEEGQAEVDALSQQEEVPQPEAPQEPPAEQPVEEVSDEQIAQLEQMAQAVDNGEM